MRNIRRMLPWWLAGLMALASAANAQSPPGGPAGERVQGAYQVRIGGYYTGTGTATVGGAEGSFVNITVPRIEGENGETGTLVATNLPLRNGRFAGTGTLAGQTVTIAGRVDPPDGEIVKSARLSASYSHRTGTEVHRGRIIGNRVGPLPPPEP